MFHASLEKADSTQSQSPTNTPKNDDIYDPITPLPSSFRIFLTHESTGIYSMKINYDGGSVDQASNASLTTVLGAPFTNSNNRGLLLNKDGTLLILNYDTRYVGFLNSTLSAQPTPKVLFDLGGLSGLYGSCQLPNGNYIIGSDQWSGKKANEYTNAGSLVRTFNSTQQWTFSSCFAISNTRVVWVDYDANTDQNGDVVVSDLSGGIWSESGRYVTNTQLSSLPASMWYSVVGHTNGSIYVFPFASGSTRNKKILKCSSSGDLSDCQLVGENLPAVFTGIDVIQGAAQLPARDDIAFVSNDRFLYLFNPNTNALIQKTDLSSQIPDPGCCEIRGFTVGSE